MLSEDTIELQVTSPKQRDPSVPGATSAQVKVASSPSKDPVGAPPVEKNSKVNSNSNYPPITNPFNPFHQPVGGVGAKPIMNGTDETLFGRAVSPDRLDLK